MEPGIVVGKRYQLLTKIGTGGMSTVYLALDTVLNKQWAAKEIKDVSDPAQRELIVQSIVTEANMIKSFDHPAIPRIVDLVDEGGTLYVIMDYVEGAHFPLCLPPMGRSLKTRWSTGDSSCVMRLSTCTAVRRRLSTAT